MWRGCGVFRTQLFGLALCWADCKSKFPVMVTVQLCTHDCAHKPNRGNMKLLVARYSWRCIYHYIRDNSLSKAMQSSAWPGPSVSARCVFQLSLGRFPTNLNIILLFTHAVVISTTQQSWLLCSVRILIRSYASNWVHTYHLLGRGMVTY